MNLERLKREGACVLFFLLVVADSLSQGFLAVDQASGTTNELLQNFTRIPVNQIAQSFTPSLSDVGFVQFQTFTTDDNNGAGVVVSVNLREGSYNGPVLSSTAPVIIFGAPPKIGTFYYPDNVPVTPGQLYFLEPVLLSPGSLDIGYKDSSTYVGGIPFINGGPSGPGDFWFREGIVVPEPGTVWLLLIGTPLFVWFRRLGNRS